ncbi:hypothetical protein AA309_07215 [Microvirga vignae]|uniref:Uncharacterized protein n=2 Tax=Microvirga vignae TaxID=1225564 RepID=A0A0H1RG69_9HYPH|nr:hypothetical protein AA309_07215 [Microvirga vignae]
MPGRAFTFSILGVLVATSLLLWVLREIPQPVSALVTVGAFFATFFLLFVLKRRLLQYALLSLPAKRTGLRRLGTVAAVVNLLLLLFAGLVSGGLMGMELLLWIFEIQSAGTSLALDIIALIIIPSIALWAYFSMATPIATSLWLRRFHNKSDGFNLAKAFDHLSISGMRVVTLADTRVAASRLSSGQCYIKLIIDLVVFLIVPIATVLFVVAAWFNMVVLNPELHRPHPFVRSEYFWYGLSLATGLYVLYGLWRLVANIRRTIMLGAGVVAVDALGATSFIAAENKRVRSGRGDNFFAGKAVLRIADAHWEAAVKSAIESVDFIIFDATQFAKNLFWELENVIAQGCAHKLVIVCGNEGVEERFQRYLEAHDIDWRERLVPYQDLSRSLLDRWRYCAMIERKAHAIAAGVLAGPIPISKEVALPRKECSSGSTS